MAKVAPLFNLTPPLLTITRPVAAPPLPAVVPNNDNALFAAAVTTPLINIKPSALLLVPLMVIAPSTATPPSIRIPRVPLEALAADPVACPSKVRVEPTAALKLAPPAT